MPGRDLKGNRPELAQFNLIPVRVFDEIEQGIICLHIGRFLESILGDLTSDPSLHLSVATRLLIGPRRL
jgi:hypothetical protein